MNALRKLYKKKNCKGLLLMDITKGYDCVDLDILRRCVEEKIEDPEIIFILINWIIMVKNMDIKINSRIVKTLNGLPMGLSLAPTMYVFYVDCALDGTIKDNNVSYIDDLTAGIPGDDIKGAKENIEKTIKNLADFGQNINTKKCMLVTQDKEVIKEFESLGFPVSAEDKLIGREFLITENDELINDDRFLDLKKPCFKAIPRWLPLAMRRLLYMAVMIARKRYKAMVWAIEDIILIKKLINEAWVYFKASLNHLSHKLAIFLQDNIFRFIIDSFFVSEWCEKLNEANEEDIGNLIDEFKEAILEKINFSTPQLDEAVSIEITKGIEDLNFGLDYWIVYKNVIKILLENFKDALVNKYYEDKNTKQQVTVDNIGKLWRNRWCINFSWVLDVINFSPRINNRPLVLFLINVIRLVLNEEENLETIENNKFLWDRVEITFEGDDEDKPGMTFAKEVNNIKDFAEFLLNIEELSRKLKKSKALKNNLKDVWKLFFYVDLIYDGKKDYDSNEEILAAFRFNASSCYIHNDVYKALNLAESVEDDEEDNTDDILGFDNED